MVKESTDILVIGAGASSAAFSWSLSRRGYHITVLEQGFWQKRTAYPQNRADWELHFRGSMNMNPNIRKAPQDYPVNDTESDITALMYNAVGGSTIVWGAHFPRLHPEDFGEGWPVSYADLEPYFDENDRMMGVSGLAGDPAFPPKTPRPMPPLPLGKFGETLAAGFNKLGWHWWPVDAAINSEAYRGRAGCNYGGSCVLGCRRGARSSPDLNYWPEAQKNGVDLRTGCRVLRILDDGGRQVKGVEYRSADGDIRAIDADIVVMAANGVGTPRMLLANELANSSDQVGRNMMVHPPAFVAGIFPDDIESYKGPVGNCLYSHEFFRQGVQFQAQRQYGGLDTALGGVVGDAVPWGENHHEEFRKRMGRTANMLVLADDLPEPENRVVLDDALRDSDGVPAPRLMYRLRDDSKEKLDFGVAKAEELMRASGAEEVLVNSRVREVFHLMGTARMGEDPERSVVNRWGRSHDVENLYIIDGSVFVTGGSANPTSTIQAMALRFAEGLHKNRREH